MSMTEKRRQRLQEVASRRQVNLTVILENVHDPHNIGAVLRSCDAVGIAEVFVLHTEERLQEKYLSLGKRTSAGTRKWIEVQYHTEMEACMKEVRSRYDHIFATHMDADARSLYELDLTGSVALLFGNEHDGVSEEALRYADGNFLIPQMGMVQSLNISVACAVSVYEAFRQRQSKGFYTDHKPATPEQQAAIFATYVKRHEERIQGKTSPAK